MLALNLLDVWETAVIPQAIQSRISICVELVMIRCHASCIRTSEEHVQAHRRGNGPRRADTVKGEGHGGSDLCRVYLSLPVQLPLTALYDT
jgi:hypothetical protein